MEKPYQLRKCNEIEMRNISFLLHYSIQFNADWMFDNANNGEVGEAFFCDCWALLEQQAQIAFLSLVQDKIPFKISTDFQKNKTNLMAN